jgi:hypothetical protein
MSETAQEWMNRHGLKVSDKARVVRMDKEWISWVKTMDDLIDSAGIIERSDDESILLAFDNEDSWWFRPCSLEPVEKVDAAPDDFVEQMMNVQSKCKFSAFYNLPPGADIEIVRGNLKPDSPPVVEKASAEAQGFMGGEIPSLAVERDNKYIRVYKDEIEYPGGKQEIASASAAARMRSPKPSVQGRIESISIAGKEFPIFEDDPIADSGPSPAQRKEYLDEFAKWKETVHVGDWFEVNQIPKMGDGGWHPRLHSGKFPPVGSKLDLVNCCEKTGNVFLCNVDTMLTAALPFWALTPCDEPESYKVAYPTLREFLG